ncbi:hypothetical protein J132_07379 [Termitomyces sp. J132]|nr:hypothetical protein C0989_009925 [Termitomyces sp. Mn162]KAH0581325.1 hypothetical protein H2248_012418 [Termitomyces sp. 'cryptogamus']KNZ80091.1 hypothetical protein J132_07379 [Termitomyces sp. J132]
MSVVVTPVYPYARTKAVVDVHEVHDMLRTLTTVPEIIDVGNGIKGFLLRPDPTTRGMPVRAFEFAVGPLDLELEIDIANLSATLNVLFSIPFDSSVTLGSVVGDTKNGVSLNIGYPGLLGGTVGVKLVGSTVTVYWEFDYLGTAYKGEKGIIDI